MTQWDLFFWVLAISLSAIVASAAFFLVSAFVRDAIKAIKGEKWAKK